MNLLTVLILSLGLCFDSFAVSLSHGLAQCGYGRMHFFRFSLVLALFQGAFPLIGWSFAAGFQHYIARYDHWVAFVLLAALGVRMIVESREEAVTPECFRFDLRHTLTLGVATSIDALITGAAMAMVTIRIVPQAGQWGNMLTASGIIFVITFVACFLGIVLGRTAGNRLGKHAEIAGGIILIAIGVKILMEHLFG